VEEVYIGVTESIHRGDLSLCTIIDISPDKAVSSIEVFRMQQEQAPRPLHLTSQTLLNVRFTRVETRVAGSGPFSRADTSE